MIVSSAYNELIFNMSISHDFRVKSYDDLENVAEAPHTSRPMPFMHRQPGPQLGLVTALGMEQTQGAEQGAVLSRSI